MPTPEEYAAAFDAMRAARSERGKYLPGTAPKPDRTSPAPSEEFDRKVDAEAEEERRRTLEGGRPEGDAAADAEVRAQAREAAKATAAAREEQFAETPVTYGGDRAPSFMGELARKGLANAGEGAGFLGKVAAAALPRATLTPDQAAQKEKASAPTLGDMMRMGLDASPPALKAAIEGGIKLGDLVAAGVLTEEQAAARTAKIDEMAALESPASYLLRLAGAIPSAGAGVVEAATTDATLEEAVPARVAEGEGFTGAGIDAGSAVGRKVGQAVEDATGLPVAAGAERAGVLGGGGLGLVADVVTGEGVSGGIRAVTKPIASRAARAFGRSAPKQIVADAMDDLRNLVTGIPELYAVESRALAASADVPVEVAATMELARGVARTPAGDVSGATFVRAIATSVAKDLPPEAAASFAARAEPLLGTVSKDSAAALEALAVEVAEAAGQKIAPGDARRALGVAYTDVRTFEIVRDVAEKLPEAERWRALVGVENAIGSEAYLSAVRRADESLYNAIEKAAGLSDVSAKTALKQRAVVAASLEEFNRVADGAPAAVRQAWGWLQQTMGYGTPLVDELGRPLISGPVVAAAKGIGNAGVGAMKSGMLSGFIVPNPKFFVNNLMTAPAIIYSTIGPRYAAAAVFSLDSMRVMRAMNEVGNLAAASRAGGRVGVSLGDASTVIARAPDGTEYTAGELARIVAANGINRSQARVELGSQGVDRIVEFAEQASAGRFRKFVRGLGGYGENIWAELANVSDNYFRINVLTRALKDGKTEAEAVRLARESLFDYGNLTDFERKYLGKVVWFWTFRRNNYRALWNNIRQNPGRLLALASANNAWSGATPDGDDTTFLATVDYAANTPMWTMVNDDESGLRYALNGPPIPQVQALEELVGALEIGLLAAEDYGRDRAGHGALAAVDRVTDAMIAEAQNPLTAAALSLKYGVQLREDGSVGIARTLDAKLVWYLQQIPGAWETAKAKFDLVEVPADEARQGGNFVPGDKSDEGSGQWKIGSPNGARMWQGLMFALLGVGMQRPLREYAPLMAWLKETAGAEPDAVSPGLGNAPGTTPWERLGIVMGAASPVVMPRFENTSDRNKAVREQEVAP